MPSRRHATVFPTISGEEDQPRSCDLPHLHIDILPSRLYGVFMPMAILKSYKIWSSWVSPHFFPALQKILTGTVEDQSVLKERGQVLSKSFMWSLVPIYRYGRTREDLPRNIAKNTPRSEEAPDWLTWIRGRGRRSNKAILLVLYVLTLTFRASEPLMISDHLPSIFPPGAPDPVSTSLRVLFTVFLLSPFSG